MSKMFIKGSSHKIYIDEIKVRTAINAFNNS